MEKNHGWLIGTRYNSLLSSHNPDVNGKSKKYNEKKQLQIRSHGKSP